MNWHSTQNDTDSLLRVPDLSSCLWHTVGVLPKGHSLVGSGHVHIYTFCWRFRANGTCSYGNSSGHWSDDWLGQTPPIQHIKAAPGVHFGESGGRLYLEWHTVISGRVGWVSWSKWIEVGQLQRPAACSIVWPNPNPLHSYHVVFFCYRDCGIL